MKRKDALLVLLIIVMAAVLWLMIKFISSIPFWAWLLLVAIVVYLNWRKIKHTLKF